MNLKDLLEVDVQRLPDEVINMLYSALLKEKNRRRLSVISLHRKHEVLKNRAHSIKSPHRGKELASLIEADWSNIYAADQSDRCFYVYAHVDPKAGRLKTPPYQFNGMPFYIGKGTGQRAYDLKRNEGHGAELRRLLSLGVQSQEIVQVVAENLSESEALCLESKLIYFFGTRFDGRVNGLLVNLTRPPTPFD